MGALDGTQRPPRRRSRLHLGRYRRSRRPRLHPMIARPSSRPTKLRMSNLPESVNGVPNICGAEEQLAAATAARGPIYVNESGIDFGRIKSAFAIALHMHQPLILAGTG